MSKHFQVGEIVIVKRSQYHPEHVGQEAEITGPLKVRRYSRTGERYLCYMISIDGKSWGARPENLCKRPPKHRRPRLSSWSACPFKPAGVRT